MSLFSKTQVVLWPKPQSVEIFLDKKENNTLSFDFNLWSDHSAAELQPLAFFLKQNKITTVSVLIPDDIILTKSFSYDSKIDSIDKKEVIGLAESFVHFKIAENAIDYVLIPGQEKTIIQATIFDNKKMDILKSNLEKLNLRVSIFKSVAASISSIVSRFYDKDFFLFYPLNNTEYTLFLSKDNLVYLTVNLKGPSLDIQKIINYSNLYFAAPTTKLFVPSNKELEINSTTKLEKTEFSENQIAAEFKKPANLPLPVLGLMVGSSSPQKSVIMNQPVEIKKDKNLNKNMENNKKNILPIVAVFVFSAALVSIIIWFVMNRNAAPKTEENIEEEAAPTSEVEVTPTEIPTPTIAIPEVSKTLKLQVLNATDINGQAATVKDALTKLGFTSIAVGNSKEKVSGNEVRLKPSLATTSAYFKEKLAGTFDATYSNTLKETGTYDVVFIIGVDLKTGMPVVSSSSSKSSSSSASITPTKQPTATPTIQ